MPIDQLRLRALTPEHIRQVARDRHLETYVKRNVHWLTEIDGLRIPSRQLVEVAAATLPSDAPRVVGLTSHEAVAVLSHNGFTSRNREWEDE